ncbi:uncharacterized protein [Eurosta solidaginis]|uniref:uncharacterized protein n=1 Tax=Eurosta solidaginis TaxID=178769 RepID=UPI003530CE46
MCYMRKIGILQILCLMLLLTDAEPNEEQIITKSVEKRGVVENIGEGLKFAGQMFGINTAADVANLVAMAFSKTKPNFMSMFQTKQKQPSNDDSEAEASQQENSSQEKQASMKNEHRQKQYHQQQSQEQNESDEEPRQPSTKQEFSPTRFVAGVLRMIGFDASKLGALALNAIVMIAEAIGSVFMPPATRASDGYPPSAAYDNDDEGVPEALSRGNRETHQPRKLREGTPIDWYLENPNERMSRLLNDALDSQLTERITEMIERVEEKQGGQAGCIKLLMCKSSPIIWGMQRAVSERVTGRSSNITNENASEEQEKEKKAKSQKKLFSAEGLFAYFPTMDEFRKHGDVCDERFGKQCNVGAGANGAEEKGTNKRTEKENTDDSRNAGKKGE